jgi:hypothetical protein
MKREMKGFDNTDLINFMNALFEPFGEYAPTARALIIDYKTETGADWHGEYFPIVPPDANMYAVARTIAAEMGRRGKTVTSVLELLNGFTVAPDCVATKAEIAANVKVLYYPSGPLGGGESRWQTL